MLRDPIDTKISAAHFWENGNFNGLADEVTKQKDNHLDDGLILMNEEVRPNFSHELSKDSEKLPQQNMEEKETAVEREERRKESTLEWQIPLMKAEWRICSNGINL
ncbi:hypothetical protein JTB14_010804 [Gonioctena quinquepunctata]|nr:hypothetical protein JTB14_010804 [Gonioctena quinquepunctata]